MSKVNFFSKFVWQDGLCLNVFQVVSLKQMCCFLETKILSYICIKNIYKEHTYVSLTTGHSL